MYNKNGHEANRTHLPEAVERLREQGFINTSPLFNLALSAGDHLPRYDMIDPVTDERVLWTPHSEHASEELIQEVIGDSDHPVFFPIVSEDQQGRLHSVPLNVRSLATTLKRSPYISAYTERLKNRADEFIEKLSLIQRDKLGVTIGKLAVNHNGDNHDDVFFSIVGPINPITEPEFHRNPTQFANRVKRLKKNFITRL